VILKAQRSIFRLKPKRQQYLPLPKMRARQRDQKVSNRAEVGLFLRQVPWFCFSFFLFFSFFALCFLGFRFLRIEL
jgi:hypothetical protein